MPKRKRIAWIVTNRMKEWRFKETNRTALVLRLYSTHKADVVKFTFGDGIRSVPVRDFLHNFEWIPTPERPPRPHTTPPLEGASLKRIAWEFGCAPKGSDEETQLHELLVRRVAAENKNAGSEEPASGDRDQAADGLRGPPSA